MTWEIVMITVLSIAVILLYRRTLELEEQDESLYDMIKSIHGVLDAMAKVAGFSMEESDV